MKRANDDKNKFSQIEKGIQNIFWYSSEWT